MLKVSAIHTIYYEQAGNASGMPVVFLHGGPGAGISPSHRRFFDPEFYRVVLFDQRGAGRSKPSADLRENTTWHLVEDIEKLRVHLGIDQWLVFGGSWGSTLALAYAVTHPDRVLGLILRGIFLCRPSEIRWFYQEGAGALYPEDWENFVKHIPLEERSDMVGAYYRRLTDPDTAVQIAAAAPWCIWEAGTAHLYQDRQAMEEYQTDPTRALPFARIECHYMVHNAFIETDQYLLFQASKLTIPTRIVQGRYDIICPIKTAWELKQVMPSVEMVTVPNAGHSAFEPGIRSELIRATDDFRGLLSSGHSSSIASK
jgi:proline iminopeptidase